MTPTFLITGTTCKFALTRCSVLECIENPKELPGLLTCLFLGFLRVSLGPDTSCFKSISDALLTTSKKKTHLVCHNLVSAVLPDISVSWDLDKLVQVLVTSDKESYNYQLWHRCALYLNKDITFLIKDSITGSLVFQLTHNFRIPLPERFETLTNQRIERTLKFRPNLKPDAKYTLLLKVKHGIAMEFQTDISKSIPVDDVLIEMGLADCIPTFRNAKIDKDALLLLTEQHLAEMKIPIGYRVKLVEKINELRQVVVYL